MSESNKDNIMRRLVFINNLHREFASVFEKSVNDLSTIFYDELEKDLKPIDKFLKFVCAYTLMHDGLIDKLQDELAADNLAMITGMIQENYLKYIDKDNLTEDDLYFIYGYALKQYESQEKITPDHCENCQKDDCTYCQYQYDSLSHDKLVKNYRLVKEAIGNKIMNPKYYDMQVTLMMINDVNLRELAPKIFDGHLSTRKRKFTFKSDKPSKIRLQKDKLLGKIEEKIGDGDKDIRTLNSDKLSTYILREFYEFENNEGMEIDKEFRDWYKSYFAKLDKSGHLIDLKVEGNINYNNLIDEFYQDCEDIKEMRR